MSLRCGTAAARSISRSKRVFRFSGGLIAVQVVGPIAAGERGEAMPSWNDIPIESSRALAEAELMDYDVAIADERTLQLDLDTEAAFEQFNRYTGRLHAHFGIESVRETVSRRGNRHIYVTLSTPLPVPERIALQACLGSDPTREFLSLKRWLSNDPNPVLLFEKRTPDLPPAASTSDATTTDVAARKDKEL
jgi:hypothetical protein